MSHDPSPLSPTTLQSLSKTLLTSLITLNANSPSKPTASPLQPNSVDSLTPQLAFSVLFHRGLSLFQSHLYAQSLPYLFSSSLLNPHSHVFLFWALGCIEIGDFKGGCEGLRLFERLVREERDVAVKELQNKNPACNSNASSPLGTTMSLGPFPPLLSNPTFFLMKGIFCHNLGCMKEAIQCASEALRLCATRKGDIGTATVSRRRIRILALLLKGDSLKFLPSDNRQELKYYRKAIQLDSKITPFIGRGFGNDCDWKSGFREVLLKEYCEDYSRMVLSEKEIESMFEVMPPCACAMQTFQQMRDVVYPKPEPGGTYSTFPLLQYDEYGNPQPVVSGQLLDVDETAPNLVVQRRQRGATRKRKRIQPLNVELLELMQQEGSSRNYRTLWNEPSGFERNRAREQCKKHRMKHFILARIHASMMHSKMSDGQTVVSSSQTPLNGTTRTRDRPKPHTSHNRRRRTATARRGRGSRRTSHRGRHPLPNRRQNVLESKNPVRRRRQPAWSIADHSDPLNDADEDHTPTLFKTRQRSRDGASSRGVLTPLIPPSPLTFITSAPSGGEYASWDSPLNSQDDVWLSPVSVKPMFSLSSIEQLDLEIPLRRRSTNASGKNSILEAQSLQDSVSLKSRHGILGRSFAGPGMEGLLKSSSNTPTRRRITPHERRIYFPPNRLQKSNEAATRNKRSAT